MAIFTVCAAEGCCKGVLSRNLCGAHYQRLRAYGSAQGDYVLYKPRGMM
jgi:hypothetical protein